MNSRARRGVSPSAARAKPPIVTRTPRRVGCDTPEEATQMLESIDRGTAGDERRWAAVVARDPAAEGTFFYSVRTTGVYCRPTCGARRARRENVAFHPT